MGLNLTNVTPPAVRIDQMHRTIGRPHHDEASCGTDKKGYVTRKKDARNQGTSNHAAMQTAGALNDNTSFGTFEG